MHLRRSWLYVPASQEKMVRKAAGLGADVVILDFEDGTPPEDAAKRAAREALLKLLPTLDFGRTEVMIRVNEVTGPLGQEDVPAAARLQPSAVVLPKVRDHLDVQFADDLLTEAEAKEGLPIGGVKLAPMIETAASVENSPAIAAATPRVTALLLGTADISRELGMRLTDEGGELDYILGRVRLAAGIAGVDAVDAPTFAFRDLERLEADCNRARNLGYAGKSALHSAQLEIIHRIFSPTPEEVEKARAIWAAWEKAQAEGKGVADLNGELVEKPFAERARRTLETAEALGLA